MAKMETDNDKSGQRDRLGIAKSKAYKWATVARELAELPTVRYYAKRWI